MAAAPTRAGFVQGAPVGHQTSKEPHRNPRAPLDPKVACWDKQWAMVQEKKVRNPISGRGNVCRHVLSFVFGDGCTYGISKPLHCSTILPYLHCPHLLLLEESKGCVIQNFKGISGVCISLPATLQIPPKQQAWARRATALLYWTGREWVGHHTQSKDMNKREHFRRDILCSRKILGTLANSVNWRKVREQKNANCDF